MARRTQIEFGGEKLFLFERPAKEVFALDAVMKEPNTDTSTLAKAGIICNTISESLRPNLKSLKWYQFVKRFKYNRMFTVEYIFNHLRISEMQEFNEIILFELEGNSADGGEKKKHTLISYSRLKWLIAISTGYSMEYIENLPITEFKNAFESIIDKDAFLRGGELKLSNSADARDELVREHMMMFPEKYN